MNKLSTYRTFLQAQGFRPAATDDYITFVFEGGNYLLTLDDADPTYFQLVYPFFWSVDSPSERTRALEAASQATMRIKTAKVYLAQRPALPQKNIAAGDDVTAAVEVFLAKPEDFEAIFHRSLQVLQMASGTFRAAMIAGAQKGGGLLDLLRRAMGLGGNPEAA